MVSVLILFMTLLPSAILSQDTGCFSAGECHSSILIEDIKEVLTPEDCYLTCKYQIEGCQNFTHYRSMNKKECQILKI